MIDDSKLRNFVSQMNSSYQDRTVFNTFQQVDQFDPDRHEPEGYIQVGRRHNLPKRFFYQENNFHNHHLAEKFADSIVSGERVHISKACINSEKVRDFRVGGIPEFNDLLNACQNLANPDHLFVPIYKELYDTVNKWIKNYVSFGGNNETIALGSSELKVRWLSTDSELRSMILIDSVYFPIVQKYGGQAKKPSGINTIEEYSSFSDGNKLICTFGEYDEQDDEKDEFDFVYRTVFSTRQLNEYSASVIKIPDTLELEG